MDPQGNVYIADACSDVVRRVDKVTNIITTYAGRFTQMNVGDYTGDNGPATLARFNYPSGIAFDAQGNLYIADYYNYVIRKVSAATGVITTVVGNGTPGYSGDGGLASNAELTYPTLVRFDNQGNLLISDTGNNVIRKVNTATGVITTVVGFYPGSPGYSGDGGPATLAHLDGVESMIMSPYGDLYVSDTNNNVIRKVNASTGVITTVVGSGVHGYLGDGGPATLASLDFDNGTMAFDSGGNLFMTDDINNVIRRVDAVTGIITTVAGQGPPVSGGYSGDGGPPLLAKFNHTESLCFQNDCDLLVVDYTNNAVRKITGLASSCQMTPTSTATPTATASFTSTATWSDTPTASFTPTVTPTRTLTATSTPTPSKTDSPSPTASWTPSRTWTPTSTSTPTATVSFTSTATWSGTPTASFTPTATPTRTPSATATPSRTWTPTSTLTPTVTSSPTFSNTSTATPLVPDIFYVSQNAMHPVEGPVSIYVQYPSAPGEYNLSIYNSAGELVKNLDSQYLHASITQSYLWNGTNKYGNPCASGVYIFSLREPFDHKIKRILLIR
jgi:hypothetical protein